jgi:dTDP-4-amino-4,6-dideoxygalactose transaminase
MKKIKLFDPEIGISEEREMIKTLRSGFWASGAGTNSVNKFEQKFKMYVNSKDCIAVNSGTAALNLALSLFNIRNKEVIVPSLTFVSTINAIKFNHGIPVFIDIDPKTGCLDTEKIEKLISKKTKAILPVHFGGIPCNLKKITEICKSYKLYLIEDAAHAAGSSFKKKKIGSHGDSVCFSFHPVKNLAMPTGGLISLNNSDYKKSRKILESRRWCGITDRKNISYDVKELADNYYMNEFSASIGLVQLRKLDKMNSVREKIAKKYHQEINLENKMPIIDGCSYHLYWILVKNRNQFIKKMFENNIQVGIHYKPVHQMTLYKNMAKLPITENIGQNIVSLPIHPNLSNNEIQQVINSVNKFAI